MNQAIQGFSCQAAGAKSRHPGQTYVFHLAANAISLCRDTRLHDSDHFSCYNNVIFLARFKSMEVYIIGSGTGIPSLRRGSPGTVIKIGDSIMLLDSGSGTLRRLLEVDIDFNEIDYLLYSHLIQIIPLILYLFSLPQNMEVKR